MTECFGESVISCIQSITVNKRLDEWVPEERMDATKMELARKDQKTPKKEAGKLGAGGSRPCSPERELTLVVCT